MITIYLLFDKIILIFDKVIELSVYIVIIVLSLIAFLFYQKKSNGSKVEDMSGHIEQLELKQDPKRSSSNLTKQGNTHPEDK
ncbi:MAG: hypothetical protein PSN36_07290 [Gammaproteobacteria bacterium]|nr:hypothetical protein [Gammaproteobacteria bacterium]